MASEGWFSWSATTEPQYSDDEFEPGIVLDPRALRGVPTKLASADRSTEMDDVLATLLAAAARKAPSDESEPDDEAPRASDERERERADSKESDHASAWETRKGCLRPPELRTPASPLSASGKHVAFTLSIDDETVASKGEPTSATSPEPTPEASSDDDDDEPPQPSDDALGSPTAALDDPERGAASSRSASEPTVAAVDSQTLNAAFDAVKTAASPRPSRAPSAEPSRTSSRGGRRARVRVTLPRGAAHIAGVAFVETGAAADARPDPESPTVVTISRVHPNAPRAYHRQLRAGDTVKTFEGTPITSVAQLKRLVASSNLRSRQRGRQLVVERAPAEISIAGSPDDSALQSSCMRWGFQALLGAGWICSSNDEK